MMSIKPKANGEPKGNANTKPPDALAMSWRHEMPTERVMVRRHLRGRHTVYRASREEILFQDFDLSLEFDGDKPFFGYAEENGSDWSAVNGEELDGKVLLIVGSDVSSRDVLKLLTSLVANILKRGIFLGRLRTGEPIFDDECC
jgi:hypothetical protein